MRTNNARLACGLDKMPPMHAPSSDRIAFLGGGNMARALIAGLLREHLPPAQIQVGELRAEARDALMRDFGVAASSANATAIAGAMLVVLAVKPAEAASALTALREHWGQPPPVLLSIAAGLTVAQLTRASPAGMPIIRAMPNRPALLGAGVTGLYASPEVGLEARERAERVARAAGRTVWLRTEAQLDVVTALSGSGPAYFLLLAEHLTDAAAALGLSRETATLLATETLYGAGLLAHRTLETPGTGLAEERSAVTSKGGTTEAALQVLRAGEFAALVTRALQAAAARSAELAGAAGMSAGAQSTPER